jgi:hypothetical protein
MGMWLVNQQVCKFVIHFVYNFCKHLVPYVKFGRYRMPHKKVTRSYCQCQQEFVSNKITTNVTFEVIMFY